ncbi:MAG: hypothetical protein IE922_10085 [Sphingomonadales bacterium]|nr:hypothetical protein [Sphingomonadales bacterium]
MTNTLRTTELIDLAWGAALASGEDIYAQWTKLSHKLAAPNCRATVAIQNLGQLDLLLRALEAEALPAPAMGSLFAAIHRDILSVSWVLNAYEIVRSLNRTEKAAAEATGTARTPGLDDLITRFALARMPLAKGEIANYSAKKFKPSEPIIMAHKDGSDPRPYVNDGSLLTPRAISAVTGAIVWRVVDLGTDNDVTISRRELSDAFLALAAE